MMTVKPSCGYDCWHPDDGVYWTLGFPHFPVVGRALDRASFTLGSVLYPATPALCLPGFPPLPG